MIYRKTIKILLIIMIMIIPFRVEAGEYKIMLSYFSNGGTVNSGNIEINSGLVFIKNDVITDITYNSNQTINHINSLDGINTFTLKKGTKAQTKNKEWYATNYLNGEKIYFSNSKKYTVKEIVNKLGLDTSYSEENGIPIEIFVQANYSKTENITIIELNTSSKTIKKGKTFKLNPVISPSTATDTELTWNSEDPSIATVDSNGNVKGIKGGTTNIIVTTKNDNKSAKCRVTVHDDTTIKVKGVKVSKSSSKILVGKSVTVSAKVSPSNATNKVVTWKSSDPKVATVKNGKITGKSEGSATITATTTDGSKKAKVKVKVEENNIQEIKLNKEQETMVVGETITLSEIIVPSNATNKDVKWNSLRDKVATVDQNGKVEAKEKGKTIISVITGDGKKTASCEITVKEKKLPNSKTILFVGNDKTESSSTISIPNLTAKIISSTGENVEIKTISKEKATLNKISQTYSKELKKVKYDYLILQEQTTAYLDNDTSQYKLGVKSILDTTPGNKNSKVYIRAPWGTKSTAPEILNNSYKNTESIANSVGAKVIYDGKAWDLCNDRFDYNLFVDNKYQSKYGAYLSALTIYATIYKKSPKGIKYTGDLTKTEAANLQTIAHEIVFGNIEVPKNSISVQLGKTKQLEAKAIPSGEITWKSNNPNIATVNSSGVVSGKKLGTATITVSANELSKNITVKVQNADLVTQNTIDMYKARYYDFSLLLQNNISNKNVKWTSENEKVAEVTSNGIVYAKRTGTVNIIASTQKGEEEVKVNITEHTNEKNYNLSNCSLMDVKVTGKSNVKVYNCLPDVELKLPQSNTHQFQSFAISSNYIYYASPLNGVWLYNADASNKAVYQNIDNIRNITTMTYIRVPKDGTTMEFMQLEYAGHGQTFDTAGLDSNGKDIIYANYAGKFRDYTQKTNEGTKRGTDNRGIAITTFTGKTDSAAIRYPGTIIAVNKNYSLFKTKSSKFKTDGVLDIKEYYKNVRSISNNNSYLLDPQTSVDDVNKRVATRDENKVLIYNESEFRSGKGKPIHKFYTDDARPQGDELYGKYFFTINGSTDATIKQYDITTGKKVATININFKEFLKDKAYASIETEGISIYNGQLYAGIVTKPCREYKKKNCIKEKKYNTIVKITGLKMNN